MSHPPVDASAAHERAYAVSEDARHRATVRRQPYEWTSTEPPVVLSHHGLWWEVVCPACGDDGGPYPRQSGPVQSLRGPYASQRAATAAASQHRIAAALAPHGWHVRDASGAVTVPQRS